VAEFQIAIPSAVLKRKRICEARILPSSHPLNQGSSLPVTAACDIRVAVDGKGPDDCPRCVIFTVDFNG
jgi:hypothetical protein